MNLITKFITAFDKNRYWFDLEIHLSLHLSIITSMDPQANAENNPNVMFGDAKPFSSFQPYTHCSLNILSGFSSPTLISQSQMSHELFWLCSFFVPFVISTHSCISLFFTEHPLQFTVKITLSVFTVFLALCLIWHSFCTNIEMQFLHMLYHY